MEQGGVEDERFAAARGSKRGELVGSLVGAPSRAGDDRVGFLGELDDLLDREGAKPPSRASARPTTIASGMAMASAARRCRRWRSATLPAPARIAPWAASKAAPGVSRLPAMIRIRPWSSLSPPSIGGSGNLRKRGAGQRGGPVTACPPSRRAPRSWRRLPARAARHGSTGSAWACTICLRRARNHKRRCRS